jgi:Flp pilus assembly protein TadG
MSRLSRNTTAASYRARGIASLEFVIIMPILLILLFGVMEYGWMLTKSGELVNAAREGARTGARADATNADINTVVDARMADAGMGGAGYTTTITAAAGVGDPVTVQVTVPYDGNVELIGFFMIPVPASLQTSVSMSKEGP